MITSKSDQDRQRGYSMPQSKSSLLQYENRSKASIAHCFTQNLPRCECGTAGTIFPLLDKVAPQPSGSLGFGKLGCRNGFGTLLLKSSAKSMSFSTTFHHPSDILQPPLVKQNQNERPQDHPEDLSDAIAVRNPWLSTRISMSRWS